ncbi:MAG: cytochrome P450 [Pseudomonadota bacterium]
MSAIVNLLSAPAAVLQGWVLGLVALFELISLAVRTLMAGGEGSFGAKIGAQLLAPEGSRKVLTVLRAFHPNLVLSRKLVAAYPNTGTAVITRRDDVLDMLDNNDDFEVVYEPRMREITDGTNFFLGMQPGWDYTRDTSAMRLAARATDVAEIVLPRATELADGAVAAAPGLIDLPQDVGLKVSSDMVGTYFGTPGPDAQTMIDWTTTMFWYLFADLGASPELKAKVTPMMADMRAYLDKTIAARKANPTDAEDVLNRCLALQASGTPGMDDLGIRNNLVGLLIGAVPTLSKASCLALDELLRRPVSLRGAQKAAREGNDPLLARYCWEALRFNPHQPVIYRRAVRSTKIARSSLREVTIPKGTLVFGATLSASFDTLAVEDAGVFRTNRPAGTYQTWGYGLHNCFGEVINRALIPAILKPVLIQPGLRWADGHSAIDTGGTPFPEHMMLAFDKT